MSDLKQCPICGGEPEFQHFNITPNVRGRIICKCGLEIRQGVNETEDDLRIIWNTRANEDTRWHKLFGTPERVADFAIENCRWDCFVCPFDGNLCDNGHSAAPENKYALLEWLRGDA